MVQILVCNIKDSSTILLKGFGPDHVVEDFSVSFQLKRYVFFLYEGTFAMVTLLLRCFKRLEEKISFINSC